jgi:hypothetical protein
MKFPMVIVYMAIAFNITVFTVMLQMDMLIFHSPIAKVVCWIATVVTWALAYFKRHSFIKLF